MLPGGRGGGSRMGAAGAAAWVLEGWDRRGPRSSARRVEGPTAGVRSVMVRGPLVGSGLPARPPILGRAPRRPAPGWAWWARLPSRCDALGPSPPFALDRLPASANRRPGSSHAVVRSWPFVVHRAVAFRPLFPPPSPRVGPRPRATCDQTYVKPGPWWRGRTSASSYLPEKLFGLAPPSCGFVLILGEVSYLRTRAAPEHGDPVPDP